MDRTLQNAFLVGLFVAALYHCADAADLRGIVDQVDQMIQQSCQADGITPLGPCSDAEFVRRIWLDLAGRIPPLNEAKAIGAGLNRDEIVQRLLKSPEFARHWGRVWTVYLTDQRPFDTGGYHGERLMQFLTDAFRDNQSYAEIVSDLILGDGTSDVSGSVNFLLLAR